MKKLLLILRITFLLQLALPFAARAVEPSPGELARAERWAAQKFAGKVQEAPPESYLRVEDARGKLQRNQRDGAPLQIFRTTYRRGLYLGGLEKVEVHLSSPAKSFHAIVGLDGHYDACGYTNGKQVFSVVAHGEKKYQSPEILVGTPAAAVDAALGGAADFELKDGNRKQAEWCGEAV
ncbi:MAG: NPCBM/NEW2 domain-containing protein, partial [Acidobacteria bacterium]|nr:NPCBM/NEW2 domain-containing protein [Acidobacteriota bacterium]